MPELKKKYHLSTLKGNNYIQKKLSSASSMLKRQPTKADSSNTAKYLSVNLSLWGLTENTIPPASRGGKSLKFQGEKRQLDIGNIDSCLCP